MKPGPAIVARAPDRAVGASQARVADLVDLRVLAQASGKDGGVLLGAFEAQGQRSQAAQAQVGLERPGGGPADLARAAERLQMRVGAHHRRAEQQVGVTADGLGRTVDHDVGSEPERTLQQRSREGVVDDAQQALFAREGAQAGEVGDPEQWVRRRLEP